MQIDIEVYPNAHATPLGAAALARLALDDTLDIADAVGRLVPIPHLQPPVERRPAAGDFRQRWNAATQPCLELVRATEAAAINCSRYLGYGDKNQVDAAAVDAIRPVLETVHMN